MGRHSGPALTSHGRVASDAIDERTENCANSNAGTREADSGSSGTVYLGSRDNGGGGRLHDDASGLHRTTDHGRSKSVPGAIQKQSIAPSGLATGGDCGEDGAWETS